MGTESVVLEMVIEPPVTVYGVPLMTTDSGIEAVMYVSVFVAVAGAESP